MSIFVIINNHLGYHNKKLIERGVQMELNTNPEEIEENRLWKKTVREKEIELQKEYDKTQNEHDEWLQKFRVNPEKITEKDKLYYQDLIIKLENLTKEMIGLIASNPFTRKMFDRVDQAARENPSRARHLVKDSDDETKRIVERIINGKKRVVFQRSFFCMRKHNHTNVYSTHKLVKRSYLN